MNPKMITWARERAGISLRYLAQRSGFERLPEWEEGTVDPTENQLYKFAKSVHVPHGYLYLSDPPTENLAKFGLEDFRTVCSRKISRLSPNMIDTIVDCTLRRDWYREYAVAARLNPVEFVGSAKTSHDHREVAASMAKSLNFGLGKQEQFGTVRDALNAFCEAARNSGVLVMKSSHVRSSTRRQLKTTEFRGFALSDRYAPLVFINGADSLSAQMFTLAHELAHLWLGDSGVSSVEHENFGKYDSEKENWCSQVAAELLVPLEMLSDIDVSVDDRYENIERKAKSLKVSKDSGGGGRSQAELIILIVGRNFATPLIARTLAGETHYKEAFQLLGTWRSDTVRKMGKILGV